MALIRVTQRLKSALAVKLETVEADGGPTASLDEWYGNVMPTAGGPLVVLLNAPTRLVLVSRMLHPVRLANDLPKRLRRLLTALALPESFVERQANEVATVRFAKTADRRYIGSLNEVCRLIAHEDEHSRVQTAAALTKLEDDLAETPHLTMPETFPNAAVFRLLGLTPPPYEPRHPQAPTPVTAKGPTLRLVPSDPPLKKTSDTPRSHVWSSQGALIEQLVGKEAAAALFHIAERRNWPAQEVLEQLIFDADAIGDASAASPPQPTLALPREVADTDLGAMRIVPLALNPCGLWDPADEEWGDEDEALPTWLRSIIASGKRPRFEMEQVLPGEDSNDPDSDPILEAVDLQNSGDTRRARSLLTSLVTRDLRCLDAHAHLGNLLFDKRPSQAISHYSFGARIGGFSLRGKHRPVLPWGLIDNRPFLRCLNGVALCLWRLSRDRDAAAVFEHMLWLNPTDNQGARFNLMNVTAGRAWRAD